MKVIRKNNYQILTEFLNNNKLEEFFFSVKDYIQGLTKSDPVIYNLIGIYYYKKKEYPKSIEFFNKSLAEKKVYQVLANKASSFVAQKNYAESLEIYNEMIFMNKKIPAGYIGKSNMYYFLHNFEESENILKEGLKIISNNFELTYSLAKLNFLQKNFIESIALFEKCISITGEQSDLLNRIGLCYEELDDIEAAMKSYLNSLKLNEYHIDTLYNLGNLYRSLGKFFEAKEVYDKILNKYPYSHEIYRYYSIVHKYTSAEDPHLIKMLDLIKSEKFKQNEKSFHQVYYALSKAYEDLKEYEKSVEYLKKGNVIRRKTVNFNNIQIARNHFDVHKEIFKNLKLPEINNSKTILPIFIVGMPRSGTTLVEQIISSHSNVYSGGEMVFVSQAIKKFFPETDLNKFKKEVINNINLYSKDMANFYLSKIQNKIKSKEKFITDKLPNNFVFIGFIKHMFPQAKIIYCKRDAKANCMSIYKNYFPDNGIWFAYDQNELKKFYHLHLSYMDLWKNIFADEIYTIHYEDLINNQKVESEKLINFCNLEWENNCLKFYENKARVSTLSTSQVRNPIYKSSLKQYDNFTKYLPELFNGL